MGDIRTAADQQIAAFARLLTGGHQRVAAHVPLPDEPGGSFLLPALDSVPELLLPVHLPDNDLDWALADRGAGSPELAPGASIARLREPTGPRLGREAIATATLVLVPALAVDADGVRLGRGGGSYDRALARLPFGVRVVALLYPDELMSDLPREPHDRRVNEVITSRACHIVGTSLS